jgi:hypothetical protein
MADTNIELLKDQQMRGVTALRFPIFQPSSHLRRLPLHGSLLATQRFVVTGRSLMILLRVCFWAAQTTDRLLPACGKLLTLLCPAPDLPKARPCCCPREEF